MGSQGCQTLSNSTLAAQFPPGLCSQSYETPELNPSVCQVCTSQLIKLNGAPLNFPQSNPHALFPQTPRQVKHPACQRTDQVHTHRARVERPVAGDVIDSHVMNGWATSATHAQPALSQHQPPPLNAHLITGTQAPFSAYRSIS